MKLKFQPDQAEYDAWYTYQIERCRDTDNDLMFIDINDGVMVFMAAHEVAEKHPHLIPIIDVHISDIVEETIMELGMAMGAAKLAKTVGLEADEVQGLMMERLRRY